MVRYREINEQDGILQELDHSSDNWKVNLAELIRKLPRDGRNKPIWIYMFSKKSKIFSSIDEAILYCDHLIIKNNNEIFEEEKDNELMIKYDFRKSDDNPDVLSITCSLTHKSGELGWIVYTISSIKWISNKLLVRKKG